MAIHKRVIMFIFMMTLLSGCTHQRIEYLNIEENLEFPVMKDHEVVKIFECVSDATPTLYKFDETVDSIKIKVFFKLQNKKIVHDVERGILVIGGGQEERRQYSHLIGNEIDLTFAITKIFVVKKQDHYLVTKKYTLRTHRHQIKASDIERHTEFNNKISACFQ